MSETESERLIREQACPMSASVHWNPKEDTEKDEICWLEIYNKLSYQIKLGLVSKTTEDAVIEIAKKFDFYRAEEVGEISRIIRDSFVEGFFDEEGIRRRINQRIKLGENETEKLVIELFKLRKKIVEMESGGAEVRIEKSPLIPALKKFPEIGDQLIGENKIKIFGEDEFKKQTINNWLDDYTIQKGSQPHNNLERSDYIFNSKNISKLTFLEKKELLLVLESYDENNELEIDADRKLILFNNKEEEISIKLREFIKKEEEELLKDKKNPLTKEVLGGENLKKDTKKEKESEEFKKKEALQNKERIQSKHTINLKDI